MFGRTTDGSSDNEAVKIANAFKPFWKKWTKEWGRNCVRSKKMTVSTAPSIITGLIGVKDAFSDTECMIPFQNNVASAQVGDTVWVKWMQDNQQTMYADNMGDLKPSAYTANRVLATNTSGKISPSSVTTTELGRLSGVTSSVQTQLNSKLPISSVDSGLQEIVSVNAGETSTISVSFNNSFSSSPIVVVSLFSNQTTGIAQCSASTYNITSSGFSLRLNNGYTSARNLGATWIAIGT
jgi:hypothetical protein